MSEKNKNDIIDISAILKTCIRNWYIFVISIVVCVGLAFVYNRRHTAVYEVKANMVIASEESTSSPLSSLLGSSANVEDELFAVSSHTIYCRVAKKLGLDVSYRVKTGFMQSEQMFQDAPISILTPADFGDTLSTPLKIRFKFDNSGRGSLTLRDKNSEITKMEDVKLPATFKTPYGTFTVKKTIYWPEEDAVKGTAYLNSYDMAAENLDTDVRVSKGSRKSNVLELSLESSNIPYAKAVLNTIMEEYNLRSSAEENERNSKTLDFINTRLGLLATELSEAEAGVQRAKSANGVSDIRAEAEYQFTKRGNMESEIVNAEAKSQITKMLQDFVSDPDNMYVPLPTSALGTMGETSDRSMTDYNNLIAKRAQMASRVGPDNPAIRKIDTQLSTYRQALLQSLNKSYQASQLTLRELQGKYNAAMSSLGSVPQNERLFRDLERQRSIKEQLYLILLKQREQTAIMLANSDMKGRIIDQAFAMSEPLSMSPKAIYVIALLVALFLAAVAVYARVLLRNKFADRSELERLTDAPILGEICTDRSGRTLIVKPGENGSTAELFRLIRTNLQFILTGHDAKVILLTSTRSGEGKSFISINLAASLALLGKKVLLVGMDIRNPQLANYLQLPRHRGLTDYLSADISLADIIRHNPCGNNVDIISAGPVPPNPSELLAGDKMARLIAQLRDMYDYVILDSAPVGMVSDTFTVGRLADATVYVTRANYTTVADIRYFNDQYEANRLPRPAIVINGTAAKQGYGYGYGRSTSETE